MRPLKHRYVLVFFLKSLLHGLEVNCFLFLAFPGLQVAVSRFLYSVNHVLTCLLIARNMQATVEDLRIM